MGKKKSAEKIPVELKTLFAITFEAHDEYPEYLCYVDGTKAHAEAIRKSQAAEKARLRPHSSGTVICNTVSALVRVENNGRAVAYSVDTRAPVISGSEVSDIAWDMERRAVLAKLSTREKEVLGLGKEEK